MLLKYKEKLRIPLKLGETERKMPKMKESLDDTGDLYNDWVENK